MLRLPKWLYSPTGSKRRRGKRSVYAVAPAKAPAKERRGGALVMVLLLTTILAAIAADLQNSTQVNLQLAANARDRLQAHFHARSAVQLELFFLRYTSLLNQTIGQFVPIPLADMSSYFVSSDTVKGLLKRDKSPKDDIVVFEDEEEKRPFGQFQGSFWIEEVVDENRKINVVGKGVPPGCLNPVHILIGSLIDEPRYDPLFETMGDSRDPLRNRIELIGNITDYNDTDQYVDSVCAFTGEDRRTGGLTEDSRYDNLPYNARYKPKNGPMLSVAEMRMVPGINDAFMRLFSHQLTVWTDGYQIYLKDADDQLLLAAVRALMGRGPIPGDEERFAKLLEERSKMRILPPPINKLSKPAFEQLLAGAGIPVDPTRKQLLFDKVLRFDDPTAVYKFTAVGRVGETTSTMTVVWRDSHKGGPGEIKYWRED